MLETALQVYRFQHGNAVKALKSIKSKTQKQHNLLQKMTNDMQKNGSNE